MDSTSAMQNNSVDDIPWMQGVSWTDPQQSISIAARIQSFQLSKDERSEFGHRLSEQLKSERSPDQSLGNLIRFLDASEFPEDWLRRFTVDDETLGALLSLMGMSEILANRLSADPTMFDWILETKGVPSNRNDLIDELANSLMDVEQFSRASTLLHRFFVRESTRVAYAEFVLGLSPEKVGAFLADVADALIEVALSFVMKRLVQRRGEPQRPDGSVAEISVIGLGNLGGREMGYNSPLKIVFIYDSIDNNNVWHRDFYNTLISELVELLRGDRTRTSGLDVDLREGPRSEVGVHICSFREAIRIYETAGRTWQRLSFVKSRVVAGSSDLGKALLSRLEPWVYQQFMSRVELSETRAIRRKLEKRAEQAAAFSKDLRNTPGGRHDIELTVQFLQLLHGGTLADVRQCNTYEAIAALQRAGCLTHHESTLLAENYARLGRLQHQIALMFERSGNMLPDQEDSQGRLAWYLGIRASEGCVGDLQRFESLLTETFEKSRRVINHLMLDAPGKAKEVAIETELLLDPEPDPELVDSTASRHNLSDPKKMMQDLLSLSSENVSFLSPHRCHHFFASISPALLSAISRTPNPDETLSSLVRVTDSLGAKATLWELMASSQPTMELMVRLCAATPYLSGILTNSPGMIDELIDSLLMNRLPSTLRLDAHSIDLCRGAVEIEMILHSFKSSAHLMIGVRDILGKESLEAIHQAIGDTAESCLRRVVEYEQEGLAVQYGDPVNQDGDRSELLTLALGKLGGREPNYHSDLDAVFLYTSEGETKRRPGGHRTTLTNQQFFNQMTRRVLDRVNDSSRLPRLYELDSRLRDSGEEGLWAMQLDAFLDRFRNNDAPLWQCMALCKARAISGSHPLRKRLDSQISEILEGIHWELCMAEQIRDMRYRMEKTAKPGNLKRGVGGTVDVEFVAQALTLRHSAIAAEVRPFGTTLTLQSLAKADCLSKAHANELIESYRFLRSVEGNLRLMNTVARHELPEESDKMKLLAFLMNEDAAERVVEKCDTARKRNREIFEQIFDRLAIEAPSEQ